MTTSSFSTSESTTDSPTTVLPPPPKRARRPMGWARRKAIHRILALLLILIGTLALFIHPSTYAFVATRTLPAGHRVAEGDFERIKMNPLPDNLLDYAPIGRVTAMVFDKGIPATSAGFLGEEFNDLYSSLLPGQELVSINIRDPHTLPMLHPGDIVSVVSFNGQDSEIIAENAYVAMVSETSILISLPHEDAYTVAAAAFNNPLAVVLTP